jgi:hypothetical protein
LVVVGFERVILVAQFSERVSILRLTPASSFLLQTTAQTTTRQIMGNVDYPEKAYSTVYHHVNLTCAADAIRLIQVLPDLSEDGVVQCTLHDASISGSKYVCLSYTWGPPGGELPIQLNGKPFYVRRNLWDFLHVARQRFTYCMLWIDAITIDQANVYEKNHQVQQMGSIFRNAEMVVTWLGDDLEAEELLRTIDTEYDRQTWSVLGRSYHGNPRREPHNTDHTSNSSSSSENEPDKENNQHAQRYPTIEALRRSPLHELPRYSKPLSMDLYIQVANNNYWKRAWVTQEILLAKAIVIVARDAAVDFTSLARRYSCVTRGGPVTPLGEYGDLLLVENETCPKDSPLHGALLKGRPVGDWDLIQILKHFQGKCCALRRDRIYSLLSLCRNGKQIKVNYDASDIEVISQVLDACHEELCFCSAATVARIIKGADKYLGHEAYTLPVGRSFQLQGVPVELTTCPFCLVETPEIWEAWGGVYFCLKGNSAVCTESHGHILWRCLPEDKFEQPLEDDDVLRYQRSGDGGRSSHFSTLCRRGGSIDIMRNESDDLYTLRFKLGILVDMIAHGRDRRPGSSHVCRA